MSLIIWTHENENIDEHVGIGLWIAAAVRNSGPPEAETPEIDQISRKYEYTKIRPIEDRKSVEKQ